MLRQVYRVIMFPRNCPAEVCSLGVYLSEYAAEQAIEKEKSDYSDKMIFKIETDYMGK